MRFVRCNPRDDRLARCIAVSPVEASFISKRKAVLQAAVRTLFWRRNFKNLPGKRRRNALIKF
ncbi:hypothetical protein COV82_00725 [Candidatus Peregrinibacteria bacterium CG11_big_fil_rev_8_21_14_0_20_46_8]|nr:MAG: hypothetical protein COV82_00725 [Candidatus Peregrinibacteria bacterium CG11_big_fil_rev_8_21_14_0_20_46_8]